VIGLAVAVLVGVATAEPIRPVAVGVEVVAVVESFLVPAPQYDACLANTLELRTLRETVTEDLSACAESLDRAAFGLASCADARDEDAQEISALHGTVGVLQARQASLRAQRNVAFGAVVVAVGVVAVGGYAAGAL